jgi:hypothetical protein
MLAAASAAQGAFPGLAFVGWAEVLDVVSNGTPTLDPPS